ncbi:MAG: GTP pyrophosphokinase [Chloroflexi bacterium]|nr:GTP pyrophosphokinase [Chloroflexota bacterium]
MLETDPDYPADSVHTIWHRVKSEERLIEKIDAENNRRRGRTAITADNYERYVRDILGLRIVCLRLSDVDEVAKYLESLRRDQKLTFLAKPKKMQSFLLRVDPRERLPAGIDLQYSGYHSVHYVVKPGRRAGMPNELRSLCAEVQLRTIFDDAWAEVDHKYRYQLTRVGRKMPDHVTRGFYALSAHLQATALQAEYLCSAAETVASGRTPVRRPRRGAAARPAPSPGPAPATVPARTPKPGLPEVLREKFGFAPTDRTVAYVTKRAAEHGFATALDLRDRVLADELLSHFIEIYRSEMSQEPFKLPAEQDIDLLNAVNFVLFASQSESVARERLKSVLQGRRKKFP